MLSNLFLAIMGWDDILLIGAVTAISAGMSAYSASRADAAAKKAMNEQKIQSNKAQELQREGNILSARAQEEANRLYAEQQGQLRDQRQYDASVEADAEREKMKSRTSRNALTVKYTGMNADDLLGIRIPT